MSDLCMDSGRRSDGHFYRFDRAKRSNTSQRQVGGTTSGRYTKLMRVEEYYVYSINNRRK